MSKGKDCKSISEPTYGVNFLFAVNIIVGRLGVPLWAQLTAN